MKGGMCEGGCREGKSVRDLSGDVCESERFERGSV